MSPKNPGSGQNGPKPTRKKSLKATTGAALTISTKMATVIDAKNTATSHDSAQYNHTALQRSLTPFIKTGLLKTNSLPGRWRDCDYGTQSRLASIVLNIRDIAGLGVAIGFSLNIDTHWQRIINGGDTKKLRKEFQRTVNKTELLGEHPLYWYVIEFADRARKADKLDRTPHESQRAHLHGAFLLPPGINLEAVKEAIKHQFSRRLLSLEARGEKINADIQIGGAVMDTARLSGDTKNPHHRPHRAARYATKEFNRLDRPVPPDQRFIISSPLRALTEGQYRQLSVALHSAARNDSPKPARKNTAIQTKAQEPAPASTAHKNISGGRPDRGKLPHDNAHDVDYGTWS